MRHASIPLAFLILFVALATSLLHSPRLLGCAAAPHRDHWVNIREESAFIIWDAKNETEHFIRRANFETQSPDFGFLVPTPSQPELGEVNDKLFTLLSHVTRPQVKWVEKHVPGKRPKPKWDGLVGSAPPPTAAAVEVLEQTTVAGLDAAVLKAEDPAALEEWLTEHDYAFRPALREWLKEYTDNKWIITAFKVSGGGPRGVGLKSVRMSFKTDKPFYPYREPEDTRDPAKQQPGQPRTLRVFVLSTERMEGHLGADPQSQQSWPAKAVWSDRVPRDHYGNFLSDIKFSDGMAFTGLNETDYGWLTEFEDHSSPRPGTAELYFKTAGNQSTLARPPIIQQTIVYDGDVADETSSSLQPAPTWWKTLGGIMLLGGLVVAGVIIACVWPIGRATNANLK